MNGTGPYTYQWSMLPPGTASFRIEGASLYFDDLRSVTDGNSGLDANGVQQWLGTNDSTDMVLKANGQTQLKLGADGTTELLGGVKLTGLNDPTAVYERIPMVDASGRITGGATIKSLYTSLLIGEYGAGCLDHGGNPIPSWESGTGKIFTDCSPVKVGIGTTAPLVRLDVRGQAYSQTLSVNTYAQDAKVTIRGGTPGTQNEFKALEVQDNSGNAAFEVFNDGKVVVGSGTFNVVDDEARLYFGNGTDHYISAVYGKGLSFSTYHAQDALVINEESGKVSIGNVTPPNNGSIYKLYVEGGITTRDVKVTAGIFPDYVFRNDYELPTIDAVSDFISENGHLPGIPSQEEVKENGGFELGDMQLMLLKKLEEQTLYIINLQKELDELKEQMKANTSK